ncbi:hypothetical protein AB0E69_00115 [Kribbella sp. NPDC026611]|uniref:hypothetical protein n=1 Tax=Kribbella sp. NPDC026611 TaxID=3154911 RepID=UPI0033D86231
MELDHYLESVRRSVENATALADDQTRSVAQRLGATLDDAGRLALISALSDAAGEISRELSPGSVELRMAGGRPEFVVTPAPSQLTGPDETDDIDDEVDDETAEQLVLDADEPTARITLRLPMSIKNKVDEAANAEGISSNAWLMRTVMTELSDRGRRGHRPPRPPRPPRGPVFGPDGPLGPNGPLGPDGVFGPNGVFGPGGPFGEEGVFGSDRGRRGERDWRRDERDRRRDEKERRREDKDRRRGNDGPGNRVQGWAE